MWTRNLGMIGVLAISLLLVIAWYRAGVYRYAAYVISLGIFSLGLGYAGSVAFVYAWAQYWPFTLPEQHTALLIIYAIEISLVLAYYAAASHPKPFGDARFARTVEIAWAGLWTEKPAAVIIGRCYGAPLYAHGFEHVLVFAPTGSGKTRSIAIPNLLHFTGSCIANDVKLTLFATTSRYRETVLGHRCYCWAPANAEGRTHRYNPLSLIEANPLTRMTAIQRIAHSLIPNGTGDPIWYQASRKLFKTLVLYLLDTPEVPVTLGEINRLVKQPDFDAWLDVQLTSTRHYDPECYRNGFSYLNNHPKTRSSILETFSGYFELFDDPVIDAATSVSDFDIRRCRQEKMTVYIGFSDSDIDRLSPLITLFWEQFIAAMVHTVPDLREEPYPVLCVLDEFAALGRLERLRRALKLLREYRVRCIVMVQYLAQILERYSSDEAQAFLNMTTKIAYAPNSLNDAKWMSTLLGMQTKAIESGSQQSHPQGGSMSTSYQYQAVPLMRPEHLLRLRAHHSLIITSKLAPLKAAHCVWYRTRPFKTAPCGTSAVPQQRIIRAPFVHPTERSLPDADSIS